MAALDLPFALEQPMNQRWLRERLDCAPEEAARHTFQFDSRHMEWKAAIEIRFSCRCGLIVREEVPYLTVRFDPMAPVLAKMIERSIREHNDLIGAPDLATLSSWGWFCPEVA